MTKKPTYKELEQKIKELEDKVSELKIAEEKQRRSESRYRTLLDFVPYPIMVLTKDGFVSYLNPGFTRVFGWTLEELEGKIIPFIPKGLKREITEKIHELFKAKFLPRHETKRLTKDGRVLDVSIRASFYSLSEGDDYGVISIIRDITEEKRIGRINNAVHRISLALPQYPDLEDILYYIDNEIKSLLNTEGSIVILLDEEKNELFVLGAAYDNRATQKRIREIRFSLDQLVAGRVIKTGEPIIVNDTSKDFELHQERDRKLGYTTRNLLLVPLKSRNRTIGVLGAINKKEGDFDDKDVDLLSMIAGTVALSVENARVSHELKKAYNEVTSLNRAKDRAINHLSHELKTPVAVISGSFTILKRKLDDIPRETWESTMEMAQRNLERIKDIQYEVEDIMRRRRYRSYKLINLILDQCSDELETLVAEEGGGDNAVGHIRNRVRELFGQKDMVSEDILLDQFVIKRLHDISTLFSRRKVKVITRLDTSPPVHLPREVLEKIFDGLLKNAIENTPDEGKIEIEVKRKGKGTELLIRDYGVGIVEDAQNRIFEGFFSTQDAMDYSSKRPFDFNAGGKGIELLRIKIFSERYNFKIDMTSTRCRFIPKSSDICPGKISECSFCKKTEDCFHSGGTSFFIYFPPAGIKK
jgi:PAS domain S-box-containing protein